MSTVESSKIEEKEAGNADSFKIFQKCRFLRIQVIRYKKSSSESSSYNEIMVAKMKLQKLNDNDALN